tara:strand:- start:2181 stop:3074 length:894 start_codon:yes stop_codon:yes gene_type:complete
MSRRWAANLILLIVVILVSILAWSISQKELEKSNLFEISSFKLSDFNEIQIDFPSRVKTHFKIEKNAWRMLSPHNARADELYVYRILSLLATKSREKLSANDLEKYGLDKPRLKITFLNNSQKEVFLFGSYNPVNEEQYVRYGDNVYLISGGFSETASFVPQELIDKNAIAAYENIKGFDFSRLESWQASQLKLLFTNGKWTAKGKGVELIQADILDWLSMTWKKPTSDLVEPYKMDPRVGYKSFDILLDNKKVTFFRIQESPKLTLYRKDEGLLYYFPGDLGFTMLSPHVKLKDSN